MQINKDNVIFGNSVTVTTATVEKVIANAGDFVRNGTTSITVNNLRIDDTELISRNSQRYVSNIFTEVNTVAIYAASGSFTVPDGVYRMGVLVSGGGGGGSDGYSVTTGTVDARVTNYYTGTRGGRGGSGFKLLSITPGVAFSFTVGAGGAGGGAGASGAAGSSTTLSYNGSQLLVATGGGGGVRQGAQGADGTCAGSDYELGFGYNISSIMSQNSAQFLDGPNGSIDVAYIDSQVSIRAQNSGTAAIAYTYAGPDQMGAAGSGAQAGSLSTLVGTGGVGGGVMFFYKV